MDKAFTVSPVSSDQPAKPLMRGWSHVLAALASLLLTVALCWHSSTDLPSEHA